MAELRKEIQSEVEQLNRSYQRRLVWYRVLSALMCVTVFITTYALILPAITMDEDEGALCGMADHSHTEECYDEQGELICELPEHEHDMNCFAPVVEIAETLCGFNYEHVHTEDCYAAGQLICSMLEHVHSSACFDDPDAVVYGIRTLESEPADDGAVAVICGTVPENARAEIKAVPLSEKELIAYFGKDRAAFMTGYVAYDISITVDGEVWQPDSSVSVTVRQPELDMDGSGILGLAHIEDGADKATDINVSRSANGDVEFTAEGFSLYVFYTSFTVDFSYAGRCYSMNGLETMYLSELFVRLDIDFDLSEVAGAVFSDPDLLEVESDGQGDWLLRSLKPFTSNEVLIVTFEDESELIINTTDAVDPTSVSWNASTKRATITVSGTSSQNGNHTVYLQYSSSSNSQSFTNAASQTGVKNGESFSISYTVPNNGDQISNYSSWRVNDGGKITDIEPIYQLLNKISISPSVKAGYSSATFEAWLTNEYTGKELYGSPSAPLTMAQLMTAFDYYYTGNVVQLPVVWCYHSGQSTPYAKYYNLHDATTGNSALADGDTIELHGNTKETRQSVIQKSIVLRSDPQTSEPYTLDFVTTDEYFIYESVACNKHPDPNVGTVSELLTRDCITVCPADYYSENLEVVFENVILDGFDAYHKLNDINDYHILQTIHNVELTFSGVTVQNFNIQSGLNSNGAISQDGRAAYDAASGSYGNRLILDDGTVIKNCSSYQGSPYSTGGIMVNDAYLEMNDAVIEDCESRNGPAIVLNSLSTGCLNDGAIIRDCLAKEQGGAIRSSGKLYINDGSLIEKCGPQSGSTALQGGAVFNNAGIVYINGGLIEDCTANMGGGVYNYAGSLYVDGGSMSGNTASDDLKKYGDISATLGSAVYQDGTMYLSGAPEYEADQDVYLPEGRVIIKNGEIDPEDKIAVVLEDETRFRDILVSQDDDDCVVSDGDLLMLEVKLSESAVATVENNRVKYLASVYCADGLDSAASGDAANVIELDISEVLVVRKVWSGAEPSESHSPITVYLFKNGTEDPVDHLTLSDSNGWTGRFGNIEVGQDGSVSYTVSENRVRGYSTEYSDIVYDEGANPGVLPGYYSVTITNTRIYDPVQPGTVDPVEYADSNVKISKKIDYLGDNEDSEGNIPDGMSDLYRLYISLEAEKQPVDLLLVLDKSGSMKDTLGGGTADNTNADPSDDSRQKILLDALNGQKIGDKYNGFISRFLAADPNNDLAILTFDNDSSYTDGRYIHKWGDTTDHIIYGLEDSQMMPEGATNYTAALYTADLIWKDEARKEAAEKLALGSDYVEPKKIMIFLSDGEPTIAYTENDDGKFLQRGLSGSTPIGNGSANTNGSSFAQHVWTVLILGQYESSGREKFRETYLIGKDASFYDDDGFSPAGLNDYIPGSFLVDFPAVSKISNMNIEVPGWASWPFGEIDNDVFTPFLDTIRPVFPEPGTSGTNDYSPVENWLKSGVVKHIGEYFDMFWLTEWAYKEFAGIHPDVVTYTIGFTEDTDGKYGPEPAAGEADTRREKAEVLKYMAGEKDVPTRDCNRYIQCNSIDGLSESFNTIVFLSGISMTDELSDYVEFVSDPEFVITLTDPGYNTEAYADCYPYLYTEDDGFTQLGLDLLVTEADPSNPDKAYTRIDLTEKIVDVVFKPSVVFSSEMKVEAAFTVQLTEAAYRDKAVYGEGYNGTLGDIGKIPAGGTAADRELITDYDPDHNTSSGMPGFYSNDEDNSHASWRRGDYYPENFPRPVVQVPEYELRLLKTDSKGSRTLSGAEFDLYRKLNQAGSSGSDLEKINSAPLVSDQSHPTTVGGISPGVYYLYETKAPSGFVCSEDPVIFTVSAQGITISSSELASVDFNDSFELRIKNYNIYDLPATGGRGIAAYTFIGISLMTGALLYGIMFLMRNRKKNLI